jgi:hypothetical protein
MAPELVLHVIPPSHPCCQTVAAALRLRASSTSYDEVREAERWGDGELQLGHVERLGADGVIGGDRLPPGRSRRAGCPATEG